MQPRMSRRCSMRRSSGRRGWPALSKSPSQHFVVEQSRSSNIPRSVPPRDPVTSWPRHHHAASQHDRRQHFQAEKISAHYSLIVLPLQTYLRMGPKKLGAPSRLASRRRPLTTGVRIPNPPVRDALRVPRHEWHLSGPCGGPWVIDCKRLSPCRVTGGPPSQRPLFSVLHPAPCKLPPAALAPSPGYPPRRPAGERQKAMEEKDVHD